MKIKAGIIGGAGYTGGELIRLLLHHPLVEITFVQSKSHAGNFLYHVHTDLLGTTEMSFTADHHTNIDVLFLCAGHGEAKKFLAENEIPLLVKIIDIGNDFRLAADQYHAGRTFVYGLPELNKAAIVKANSIANPGCFATALQLALLPLAQQKILQQVHVTAITGSTGAGQALSSSSHFSWRANNIQAYKTLTHQHLGEIEQTLFELQGSAVDISMIPWRGDFTRGIFSTTLVHCSADFSTILEAYNSFYQDAPFTHISDTVIHLKQVVNTNNCVLQLEKVGQKLVIHSIIDNLLKGASGQAVQNMNLLFGFPENTGLQLKATAF
jgi:N-acetyl-gamma-glutamyl-phosphate reductase